MKHILAPILLLIFLFPALALGEEVVEWDDLVVTNGLVYKKFTDVPFTGKTTGQVQGTYKDGVLDGPWFEYHYHGGLKSKGDYKNGKKDGPWVVYYEDGQLHEKGDWKDGKMEGPWVVYNGYGTVDERFTGTYKNGVKVD